MATRPVDLLNPDNPYSWLCRQCYLARAGPCPLHPGGPQGQCLDFRLAPTAQPDHPTQLSTYAGEVIMDPSKDIHQQLALLNTHPLFTGRCPTCEMPITVFQVHWDCQHCGWVDDSV